MALAFCTTMTLSFLVLQNTVFARPCEVEDDWYFSDNTCTTQVGRVALFCDGRTDIWGSETSYYVAFIFCCGNSGEGCGECPANYYGPLYCTLQNCPGTCGTY
jgi:hypothetical protein